MTMTEQPETTPRPPITSPGDQTPGEFYALAMGPRRHDHTRADLGTFPAGTFAQAAAHLDRLNCYGLVEVFNPHTEIRDVVARRDDEGTWWALTADSGWQPMPRPPQPVPELPPPPREITLAAAERGHIVETAPPVPLSKAERWTCAVCSRVVLRLDGRVYGTAITERCEEPL